MTSTTYATNYARPAQWQVGLDRVHFVLLLIKLGIINENILGYDPQEAINTIEYYTCGDAPELPQVFVL